MLKFHNVLYADVCGGWTVFGSLWVGEIARLGHSVCALWMNAFSWVGL